MGEIQDALRQANLARGTTTAPLPAEPEHEPRERQFGAVSLPPPAPRLDREPTTTVAISRERDGSEAWPARALLVEKDGPAAETLRHLAVRLRRELEGRQTRTVAVVSAQHGEGKTTLSCNLALAMASLSPGRSVALVDLDLRKPSVARALELPCTMGLEDVLQGRAELVAARVCVDHPPLDVYPALRPQREAHKLLGMPALRAMLRALEKQYELVVIDTPPVLLVPDAVVILETTGTAVAVARAGHSRKRALEALCEHLPPGSLIGSILNEGPLPVAEKSYGYYDAEADEGD